ncbi:DNA-binding transcriptional regulator, LysR family [Rhizobiales bacterium GAS113]|nr:DNA-binding transcriptional regulator, LysR family [Rhizobiales bacterium GAS113]
MDGMTIHQLLCFDAVVTEGGFQAGAAKLRRTHSTVFTSIRNLESQLGLRLLDREGYRVALTDTGRSFHDRTRVFLRELSVLRNHASQLAMGEESELRVVIGDLCPLPQVLGLLRRFFDGCPATRLHLHFEAISGPWERLFDDEADLIIHHIDKSDPRLEFIDLFSGTLIPVVAPNFLSFPVSDRITLEQMRNHVQCVIRDTARHSPSRDYYLIEGARSWTVNDQLMKKEIILQGMGWGHMPSFLIADELREDRLISIAGQHLRGGAGEIVAARRRDRPHGPIADRLWFFIKEQAPSLGAAIRECEFRPRDAA